MSSSCPSAYSSRKSYRSCPVLISPSAPFILQREVYLTTRTSSARKCHAAHFLRLCVASLSRVTLTLHSHRKAQHALSIMRNGSRLSLDSKRQHSTRHDTTRLSRFCLNPVTNRVNRQPLDATRVYSSRLFSSRLNWFSTNSRIFSNSRGVYSTYRFHSNSYPIFIPHSFVVSLFKSYDLLEFEFGS